MKKLNNPRPVKLTMETKGNKDEFMSKLGRLKYAETEYKKLRVTDDYIFEER